MRIPKLRKHSSGKAFVEWHGRRWYFAGLYGSAQAHEEHRRFIQENIVADAPKPPAAPLNRYAVADVVYQYLRWAVTYYPAGPRSEMSALRASVTTLLEEFGDLRAVQFGPLKLKQLQQRLIEKKHGRGYINSQVNRIRRIFRWAASEAMIPVEVHQGLQTVAALKKGRTAAKESTPRAPAPWKDVSAVLLHVSPTLCSMISLQWYTGARSDNICNLRPREIDIRGDAWIWRPENHKGTHRGGQLVIAIGPKCQAAIRLFLKRAPDACMFSPRESARWYNDRRANMRKTKRTPSEQDGRRNNRRFSDHYQTHTYCQAVKYGIQRAGVTPWTPHQLRHSRGSIVRERYGIEAAQAALGHESMDATEIYTERRIELARKIALEIG